MRIILDKELGTVGATYYTGYGDYTYERDQIFDGITLEEMVQEIQQIDIKNS